MKDGSILNDIKQLLNLEEDDSTFDTDVLIHLNTAFSILDQIGAAPAGGFTAEVEDKDTKWSDFFGDLKGVSMVKSWIYLKVQLIFDPPATSFTIASKEKLLEELTYRINVLEFVFNPSAKLPPVDVVEEPLVWEIDERESLPAEMEKGEVAFDPVTGNAIRKI
jgi:hypothetical protein